MIGMSFSGFVTLLFLGFISSFVLHVLARYRVLAGLDGFMFSWIAAWIGGWLASPVFGHWGIRMNNLYIIPAMLGVFAGPFLVTATLRALTKIRAAVPRPETMPAQPAAASQFEMRKAS